MDPNLYSQMLHNAVTLVLQQLNSQPHSQLPPQMAANILGQTAVPQQGGLSGYWQPMPPQQALYSPLQHWLHPLSSAICPIAPQLPPLNPIQVKKPDDSPESLSREDEKILMEAFREGTERGLTSLQVFQGLDKVCVSSIYVQTPD